MSEFLSERADDHAGSVALPSAVCLGDGDGHILPQAVKDATGLQSDGLSQRYRDGLRHLAGRLEDDSEFLHVLAGSHLQSGMGLDVLSAGMQRRMAVVQSDMHANMPRAMRTAHLAMLQDALESGDVRTAEYAVNELLCHAPDDGTVEAACVSGSGEPVLAAVRERLARYRFRYVATLGSAVGGVPMSVACRPSCGALYIADSGKNVVRRYTATGAELAPLDCGINKPLCIFSDGQDGVWICDYGNNRLVCLGKDDRIERVVDFSSYDVLKELQGRIRYGCAAGDRHYLVFAAEKTGGSVWAELRIGQAACTLRLREPAGDVAPARVFRADGELYFFAWPHAKAARIEAATRKRLPSGHGLSYPIVRGFVAVGSHRFLLSGNTVIKLDAEGDLLFSYSLEKELGVLGVSALSMAAGKRGGEDVLYISDGITGSVYVFAI